MLKRLPSERGVSLIELVIAMSISAALIVMAVPSFREAIQNTRIRTAAESIQNGLQLARAEAVRRNLAMGLNLTDSLTNSCVVSAAGLNWVVSGDNPAGQCAAAPSDTVAPRIFQVGTAAGSAVEATVAAGQATFTFNGWGRLAPAPAGPVNINITNPTAGNCVAAGGKVRCLRVAVSTTGQIHLCDPAITAATDPQKCP